MKSELLKHREKVAKSAELIRNKSTNGVLMWAIDINSRGYISEPFSDPENLTIYRSTLSELSEDTLIFNE